MAKLANHFRTSPTPTLSTCARRLLSYVAPVFAPMAEVSSTLNVGSTMPPLQHLVSAVAACTLVATLSGCSGSADPDLEPIRGLAIHETSNPGIWSIDGTIELPDVYQVRFAITSPGGGDLPGAVLAFEVKDLREAGADLSVIRIGEGAGDIPGLRATVNQARMGATCGELTLTVVAHYDDGNGEAQTSASADFLADCANATADGDSYSPVTYDDWTNATLVTKTDTLGGAKSTVAASIDLDSGLKYTSSQVVRGVADEIDLIFNGSKVMSPLGTPEAGYMSLKYAESTSLAFLIPVTVRNTPTTQADLIALIDADKGTYVLSVSAGTSFIVFTSLNVPVLVTVLGIDDQQVMTFRYAM